MIGIGAILLVGACGESPPESQYIDEAPGSEAPGAETPAASTSEPATDSRVIAGVNFIIDPSWNEAQPASSMRAAQFSVGEGDQAAEIVVFHFGPGQGGSVDDNLVRWARLVLDENDQPTIPEVVEFEQNGLKTTVATFEGDYLAGPPGGQKSRMTDWTLIAAVIERGPQGSLFPRLVGPSDAVNAARPAFEAFVRSAQPTTP